MLWDQPSGRITINYRFFFASGAEHRHRFDRHKSFSLFAFSNAHFRDSGSLCPIECIPRQFEPTRKCNKKRIVSIKRYLNPSSLSNDIPLQLRQRSINPSQRLTKRERERKRESKNIYHALKLSFAILLCIFPSKSANNASKQSFVSSE